jgi:hypothetical protein
LATGADGNVYFTAPAANQLVRFNPSTQKFGLFDIPTANSGASFITSGLDGKLYFTETKANQIGQFDPVAPFFASFLIPTASSGAAFITSGSDGNLYFTESTANNIGAVELFPLRATTTQLNVTPNPATVGQVVTLTAVVNTRQPGRSTGTVAFSVDGVVRARVRITLLSGQGQATFTIGQLPPGSHTVIATFRGNAALAASASAPVTLVVNPAPEDGPVVLRVSRFGFHSQHTIVIVGFDNFLNPVTAQNVANYLIRGPGGSVIPVSSAVYNLAARTVTLLPAQRLSIRRAYLLTLIGTVASGISDPQGRLLDGGYTGQPGSNFQTTLTAASLAGR